jgi:hypothetical protein
MDGAASYFQDDLEEKDGFYEYYDFFHLVKIDLHTKM